jgi:hypothetical protein
MLDVALSLGGSEAIVESFYGVMDSQQQCGGQDNDTLALRTKVDWCLPDITQCLPFASECAKLYVQGGDGLARHYVGGLQSSKHIVSKVYDRHASSSTRLPYLL